MALLEPGAASGRQAAVDRRADESPPCQRGGDARRRFPRREAARQQVDEAKIALGERGEPWWTDGAPDWNRHMAKNTPYAEWFHSLAGG